MGFLTSFCLIYDISLPVSVSTIITAMLNISTLKVIFLWYIKFYLTGTSVNDAKEALYDIGATGNVHPGFHGSWAFVGYTGPEQVKWATTISQPRYKGPAVIEEMIASPSEEAEISKIFTRVRRRG